MFAWQLGAIRAALEKYTPLPMLIDQVADAEHDLGAAAEGGCSPALEGLACHTHGRVDLLGRCKIDLARDLAGGRVVDRPAASRRAGHTLAGDPVVDMLEFGCLGSGRRLSNLFHAHKILPTSGNVARQPAGAAPPRRTTSPGRVSRQS